MTAGRPTDKIVLHRCAVGAAVDRYHAAREVLL